MPRPARERAVKGAGTRSARVRRTGVVRGCNRNAGLRRGRRAHVSCTARAGEWHRRHRVIYTDIDYLAKPASVRALASVLVDDVLAAVVARGLIARDRMADT